jgi:hypothetical protein
LGIAIARAAIGLSPRFTSYGKVPRNVTRVALQGVRFHADESDSRYAAHAHNQFGATALVAVGGFQINASELENIFDRPPDYCGIAPATRAGAREKHIDRGASGVFAIWLDPLRVSVSVGIAVSETRDALTPQMRELSVHSVAR